MGEKYKEINEKHAEFISRQKIFFVGTSAPDGRVNVSPKGMDSLKVEGSNKIYWLNLTGSSNETAAHLLECDRMTIMFCAFEGDPRILKLYGHARTVHPRDESWDDLIAMFPPIPGARQIIVMTVDLVHTSCGMGVPSFDYAGDRDLLKEWAGRKSEQDLEKYWTEKNLTSIDGKPTGIFEN
jgi:hypothetical protein